MFWIIYLFTYSTKRFSSNSILLHFFFNGWENHLHHPRTSLHNKNMQKKRRRKFHAFNKKHSFILLRYAHYLLHFTQLFCYTFYDYILFIIIFIRLSFLFSFLSKFVLLFFANLFFHIFVHFFNLSFSFFLCVFSYQ